MLLTKSELEIMNVIWAAGRGLSRNEIITMSENKSWKDGSIHILLNGLLKKQAIKETGFVRCGKTYARVFSANISCEDYYAKSVFPSLDKGLMMQMASAMINSEDFTDEMVDELEAMLSGRRAKKKGEGR